MGADEVTVTRLNRKLTDAELRHIASTIYNGILEAGVKGHPLQPLAPFVSFDKIYQHIRIANNSGYLEVYAVGDHIVGIIMYDFGSPWWADVYCLKEMSVYAIDPEFVGFGRIAIKRLEELAIENDCTLIETGSAICLDPKMVENLYMKKGKYQFSYPNYIRIVPNCGTYKDDSNCGT